MAVPIGNGRYYKLFPGNSPPKRLLIEELSEPGLLSSAFVQGIVAKVYPVKCSERYGKLCKIVLREDVEKRTRNAPRAAITAFLLGDLADEGRKISEGDRVVLSEVIVECSPTDEHIFQLIAWREKSQASIWVINDKGNVRVNTTSRNEKGSEYNVENVSTTGNFNHSADSGDEGNDPHESCEYDFLKETSSEQQGTRRTKQKVFERRKGKFCLGPRGVTPSTSRVRRKVSDVVVQLDKSEARTKIKTRQEEECTSKSLSSGSPLKRSSRRYSRNVSSQNVGNDAPISSYTGDANVTASPAPVVSHVPHIAVETGGQSVLMSQKTGPGAGHLSLSIQSGNPNQPSNVQCTHIELTPSKVSTKIWNGDLQGGQMRDQCQISAGPCDLPQLMAPGAGSSSAVENHVASAENCPKNDEDNTPQKTDDPKQMPSEDSIMPDFEQEDQVFISARRRSSSTYTDANRGSPGMDRRHGIPHHFTIDEDLSISTSVRSLIPDDYTPVASLLAGLHSSEQVSGVKRSPLKQALDPKRLRTSPGPSHRSPSPDRAGGALSGRYRKRSSRAAADYTVPPGYTTLANLQPETTVNVYGVVKSFKPAWKCRGTDMCSVLMLMDPTIAESTGGLECVSFQPTINRLPAVHMVGDIVRLHRIKISQYQGKLQAKSTRGFAAIVFDRDADLPVTAEMARVSSSTFTLTQNDKETIESLKNWCDVHPVLFPPTNFVTVAQINPDSYFDLVCQVLGVALHRTLDCVVLYVTDGTQPKSDIRKGGGDEYNLVETLGNRSSEDDDVISVFLYGAYAEVARLFARKGSYVILHNVHSQILKPGGSVCSVMDVVKPYVELCIHRGTGFGRGVTFLSADSPEVKQLKKQQNG